MVLLVWHWLLCLKIWSHTRLYLPGFDCCVKRLGLVEDFIGVGLTTVFNNWFHTWFFIGLALAAVFKDMVSYKVIFAWHLLSLTN